MALVEVGTATRPGATGSQTYSTTEQVKALQLFFVHRAGNGGGSAHAVWAMGMATDRGGTAAQRFVSFASEDNIGSADVYVGAGSADVIKLADGTTATVDTEIAFVEFGATGFTLDWQNLPTTVSSEVYYIAWCGPDVEDALVSQLTSGTGTQDVTVVAGFGQPQLVFFPVSWNGVDPPAAGNGDTGFGFAVKQASGNGRAIRWGSQDNATTQASNQAIYNNRCVAVGDNGAVEWGFQLAAEAGWPTDGFEITWSNTLAGFPVPYLALRFSANVTLNHGETAMPTAGGLPVVQTLTTTDTPAFAMILHARTATANTVDTTSTNVASWGVGMIDGAGNERFVGGYDDDAQATASVTGTAQTNAKALQTWLPSSDTLDGEADGVVSTQFELSWTDLPPSAFLYEWLTLGLNTGAAPAAPRMLGTLGVGT